MSDDEVPRQTDSDLRQAAHQHGARPGSDLWKILVELQRRRDDGGDRPDR